MLALSRDEFHGPRSDFVKEVALVPTTTTITNLDDLLEWIAQPEPPSVRIRFGLSTFLFRSSPPSSDGGGEGAGSGESLSVHNSPIICVAVVVVYVCAKMEDKEASNSKETQTKKARRVCHYNVDWKLRFVWLNKCDEDNRKGYCKLCKNSFTVAYDGLKAVTHHAEAKEHKECESAAAMSHRMKSFFFFFLHQKAAPKVKKLLLFNFYEDSFEDSTSIKERLCEVMDKSRLPWSRVTAYGADNESVNFGVNNSVFQKLKSEENNDIIAAHCNDHIFHNCAKNALKVMPVDVENIVMKVFAEFSCFAKKREDLKECFDFFESEYREVIRHVPTRWLSLCKAFDRMLSSWGPLKSCLNLECGRLPTLDQLLELWSISPWKQQTPLEQIYDELAALQSVFPSLKLEGNSIEMWCKFFQKEEAPNLLKIVQFVCSVPVSNAFVEPTRGLLATDHVILNHGQVTRTTLELAPPLLTTIPHQREDVSALDRFNVHRSPTRRVFSGTGLELMTYLPWSHTLTTGLPQPRIFSVMGNVWTDERNRVAVNTVKSELCIFFNISSSCTEFKDAISTNRPLLKAASSNAKHTKK
ncbi:uncharacterized protein TNCV_1458391 [Trichonephila clavipes]|nr:uncharacterized protein TNCV_1458391 [Trichonephila clavipes]